MGESITTRLDAPYGQQPETRAAAVRVMQRLGATDLIEILGLDDTPAEDPNLCPDCQQPLDSTGRPCRRRSCPTGRERRPSRRAARP
jgi:hypothetical protein